MKTFRISLSPTEKEKLKKSKLPVSRLCEFTADEIMILLNSTQQRAEYIAASVTFQSIPSIGPKFADDLISLGYNSLDNLLGKDGPTLFNELEQKQGFWTDPCVEDQFWLAVYYANDPVRKKNWWDFTAERKAYRAKYGYPSTRPQMAWHELV
jgi:hypothetical protein